MLELRGFSDQPCARGAVDRPSSDSKSLRDDTSLLAFVQRKSPDRRARAGIAPGIRNFPAEQRAQARLDIGPRAHVLRFLLAPDEFLRLSKRVKHSAQLLLRERIKLLHPNNRRIRDFLRRSIVQQVEINLP